MINEKIKFDGHKYKKKESKTIGLSPQTVNTRMKTVKILFRFLFEEGYISDNPTEGIRNINEPQEAMCILDEDEQRQLLNAPDQRRYSDFRDYVLMNLLLDGMMRITEAVSLKIQDVDFKNNLVHIRASNAKSRKSRTLPMQKRTVRLLNELLIENRQDFDSENIFLTNYGEAIDRELFRKRLKTYAKRARIQKNVHPHLFRHTAATMFLEAGGDVRHLQILLGHSDLRMVLRYTHLSNKSLRSQHDKYSPMNKVLDKRNRDRKIIR